MFDIPSSQDRDCLQGKGDRPVKAQILSALNKMDNAKIIGYSSNNILLGQKYRLPGEMMLENRIFAYCYGTV
jgi:hypothetical protein